MRWKIRKLSGRAGVRAALGLGLIAVMAYIGSYLPRRNAGGYQLTQSGEIRLSGVSALSDMEQWSPEGCWWQPQFKTIHGDYGTRRNGRGLIYAPLIWLDRHFHFPDRTLPHFAGKGVVKEAIRND